jgi:hypothetical protein
MRVRVTLAGERERKGLPMKWMLSVAAALVASSAVAAPGTWSGDLTTSSCVGAHTSQFHQKAASARDCALDCIKEGAKYVLVSDGKVYQIANQKHGALKTHVGRKVTVTGDMKGETISVSRVEAAPAPR